MSAIPPTVCDVLVIGSGAAGLTAAITARLLGLDVVVAEREAEFGGTTAMSGGMLWIPGNPVSARQGVPDSAEQIRTYLRHELGNRYDEAMIDAFLDAGPRMVDCLERRIGMRFVAPAWSPDYHPDVPGAARGGRPIRAEPVDAAVLGDRFAQLKWPLPEMMLFGGMMIAGEDLPHFLNAGRSLASARHVARLAGRFALDRLRHKRGRRLTNGNALVARLARGLFDLGVPLHLSSPAAELIADSQGVHGAVLRRPEGDMVIRSRCGVVLATGGFSADAALRAQFVPHAQGGHASIAASGNDGSGLRMARSAGGELNPDVQHAHAYVPLSRVPRKDGSIALVPHLLDRAKPGVIAVDRGGRRFTNEAASYHDFVPALVQACAGRKNEVLLVCDHRALRRYGLGPIRPFPAPLGRWLRSGYLLRGATPQALGEAAGMDGATLAATIARFNAHAAQGEDPDFGKGGTEYNRFMGDPSHTPNACLAPLDQPPLYAVRILPGDLGSMMGLRTNAHAQVLDRAGRPIKGLYAAGNDMMNICAGTYPGPGITLGPAMTFGFVAAEHMARAAQLSEEHAA